MPEILFAAEVAFRSQKRRVSEQKLNLLKFSAICVAQLRTSPTQIVRRDTRQSCSLATTSHDVPDDILRETRTPDFSRPGHSAEDFSLGDLGC
jgi:hypothetical protein